MTAKKIGRGLLTALGLVLAAFFISPILILIVNSFKSLKDIYLDVLALPNRETFTASNYPQAYEKLDFFTSFGNSLAITVSAIVLLLIFCSMAAWVLARYKTKMSSFIFLLYAAATLIPFQCVMLPLIRFMDGLNLMNRPGLVFMYLGFGSSLSIILLHGFIKNVPVELEEAARIDGASPFQQFVHLTIPLLKPTILLTAIMSTSGTLQLFDESVNLTAGGPGKATMTLTHYIYNISFVETPKFNYAAALSVFILVVVAVLSAIQMEVGDKRD